MGKQGEEGKGKEAISAIQLRWSLGYIVHGKNNKIQKDKAFSWLIYIIFFLSSP